MGGGQTKDVPKFGDQIGQCQANLCTIMFSFHFPYGSSLPDHRIEFPNQRRVDEKLQCEIDSGEGFS